MPQFYFHFFDGIERCDDEHGVEFVSAELAYMDAFKAAVAMWSELLAERKDPRRCVFEIAGEHGEMLFRLPFVEILENCDGVSPLDSGISRVLTATHRRACAAREALRLEMLEARQNLEHSAALLQRFNALEPTPCGQL